MQPQSIIEISRILRVIPIDLIKCNKNIPHIARVHQHFVAQKSKRRPAFRIFCFIVLLLLCRPAASSIPSTRPAKWEGESGQGPTGSTKTEREKRRAGRPPSSPFYLSCLFHFVMFPWLWEKWTNFQEKNDAHSWATKIFTQFHSPLFLSDKKKSITHEAD